MLVCFSRNLTVNRLLAFQNIQIFNTAWQVGGFMDFCSSKIENN